MHHTASKKDNYSSIKKYQSRHRGWKEPAYHLILSNGSTTIKKGFLEPTQRYLTLDKSVASRSSECNRFGLHIVIVGNYESDKIDKKTKANVKSAIYFLQKKFYIPQENVVLHRDCSKTLCPGKFIQRNDIHDWLKDETLMFSRKIVEQQKSVISKAFFSFNTIQWYYSYILVFNLIFVSFIYFITLIIFREFKT